MQVRYSNYYLAARKEDPLSKTSQRTGTAVDIGKYLVKVQWNDGHWELVPRADLEGLPAIVVDELKVLSLEEVTGVHLKVLEHWKKINGQWVSQEIVHTNFRKAQTDIEKYKLSKAPESIRKKHDLRGLTATEWKLIM